MANSDNKNDEVIELVEEDDAEMPPLDDIIVEEDKGEFMQVKKNDRKRKSQPMEEDDPTMAEEQFPEGKRAKPSAEIRKIAVLPHRYQPLRKNWQKIVAPIVNELKLQIRYNLKTRNVEIRCPDEANANRTHLQKAADFVHAFLLGFELDDAISLIRLDHLFMESFEINDVKTLRGDHLSRAIGRIAGKDGRVKMTIENVTKTRIVLANDKIHLLGAYNNLQVARRTICSLIMGTPINKIYGNLRNLSSRLAEQL